MTKVLIHTNFSVLKGRKYYKTDFNVIGPQGCSVIDFCIVRVEMLKFLL